jgi:chemotaxis protein MotB
MGGGGGGAWKVAYADFVTAMMAFFLVMWLCGQDQQMKQAIARYFNNPLGIKPIGQSPFPQESGNIFEAPNIGEVPKSQAISLGMGRETYTEDDQIASPGTKLMSDHLLAETETSEFWQQQAEKEIHNASFSSGDDPDKAKEIATNVVARKMQNKMLDGIPRELPDVYRDMLFNALQDVNWEQIAEDVVGK